jgi:hypothetical protein
MVFRAGYITRRAVHLYLSNIYVYYTLYIQGYLEEKLALESVKKLIKKTKGIIEESMKMIEFVDNLVCEIL